MQLITRDINDIRRKLNNWLRRQSDLGYKTEKLIEKSKHVETMQDVLDLLCNYYMQSIDIYWALCNMGIIGLEAKDTTEFSETLSDDQIRESLHRELNILWAQVAHHLDNDETDILRI